MLLRDTRFGVVLAALLAVVPTLPARGADEVPQELSFAHFFRRPVGPRGLEIDPALRAADGRQVRLTGYIVAQEQPQAGRFLLAPLPLRMSEHADGDADDLPPGTVTVLLDAAQADRVIAPQRGPVSITGRLAVGREEDGSGRVSWLRLQLAPQAVADRQPSAAETPQPLPH